MGGDFAWTLTSVEISSGWAELRAIWNRGQHATFTGLESIWESQPWLKNHGIHQTRSRPYYKNDQAYVEQKNHTHVRQFLGFERIEHHELLDDLNELLKLWSLWRNLFCVTMKQTEKKREGSRQIRTHEKRGRTPAQRLLDSEDVQEGHKRKLRKLLDETNPFAMREEIQRLEDRFWNRRTELYRQAEEEEASLALAGGSPLRSDPPARAETSKSKSKNKVVTVS